MKPSSILLTIITLAAAGPFPQLGELGGLLGGRPGGEASSEGAATDGSACTPSSIERVHLSHHHDMNTGDLVVGNRVARGVAKVPGGSGCSPLWAGGVYDDSLTFTGGKYPDWLQAEIAKGGGGEA